MVVNSKCKTKRKYTDNSIDKTQKGGFLNINSPEYTSISQALDVLATVKNKYVYIKYIIILKTLIKMHLSMQIIKFK